MLKMPHHGSLRCVLKMIMGKYVHLYDFGKTCGLIIIFTNASHYAPSNPFIKAKTEVPRDVRNSKTYTIYSKVILFIVNQIYYINHILNILFKYIK